MPRTLTLVLSRLYAVSDDTTPEEIAQREQQEADEVDADAHTDFPLPGTGGGSSDG